MVDPVTVLSTHLTEILKNNMSELLSYTEVRKLLDAMPTEQSRLVEDIIPAQISYTGVQRVLQTLLNERISIRDLATIIEGIAEATGFTTNQNLIAEHVRIRLARQISAACTGPAGYMALITIAPQWEHAFAEARMAAGESGEGEIALAPSKLQALVRAMQDAIQEAGNLGESPVLVTSPGAPPIHTLHNRTLQQPDPRAVSSRNP